MSLPILASHSAERALLIIDGAELVAYDGESEAALWRRSFERRPVGITYADAGTLAAPAGDPFRSASAAHVAIVVDERGGIYVVNPSLGEVVGRLDTLGSTRALVTSPRGDLALATDREVHLWRSGTKRVHEAAAVSALAFSKDGSALAVATKVGDLRIFALDASSERWSETFAMNGLGVVADLASHENGAWLVAGIAGVGVIERGKARRFDALWSSVQRLAFDATGTVLAVQTADASIVCYAWPKLTVVSRIEFEKCSVRGMAFGRDGALRLGLDQGDICIVDLATSATRRTKAGRSPWQVRVHGATTNARVSFEARAFDTRLALVGIALAGGGLRACLAMSAPEPQPITIPAELFARCDHACSETQLGELVSKCKTMAKCAPEAESALAAFKGGRCAEMTDALAHARLGSNDSIDAFRVAATRAAMNACGLAEVP